jgi:hypothetical protein
VSGVQQLDHPGDRNLEFVNSIQGSRDLLGAFTIQQRVKAN